MEFHEIASIFPMLAQDKHQDLVESMKIHGYFADEPITTYEGQILDGRNRYLAATDAGVDLAYQEFDPTWTATGNPALWVIAKNANRRQLTPRQFVFALLGMTPLVEKYGKEAKDRHTANTSSRAADGTFQSAPAVLQEPVISQQKQSNNAKSRHEGEALDALAQATGLLVSSRSLYHGKQVLRSEVPFLIDAVQKNRISLESGGTLAGALASGKITMEELEELFNVPWDIVRTRVTDKVRTLIGRKASTRKREQRRTERRANTKILIALFLDAQPKHQDEFLEWLDGNFGVVYTKWRAT